MSFAASLAARPETRPRRGIRNPLALLTLGAIALRLILFIGRGDYVAYDEAWYLLLGQNLIGGDGYTLSGLRHVALSPLFPLLAGVVDAIVGHPVWAGRIIAAVASGLLVLPCWYIFRRFAGRRTAWLGCGIVAVLPSLAPFAAPYWVGWDMFVGAEPLFHFLLYGGIALFLRAGERGRTRDWVFAGATFALAYLARPEAVVVFGLLGLAAVATLLSRGTPRALPTVMGGALAFVLVALPYWIYLHDATDRWALTGRGVSIELPGTARRSGDGRVSSDATIERMLWRGEHGRYVRRLYALAPSGTRLSSSYWGVRPRDDEANASAGSDATPAHHPTDPSVRAPADAETVATVASTDDTARRDVVAEAGGATLDGTPLQATKDTNAADAVSGRARLRGLTLYARSIGKVLPWFLLPFMVLGAVVPGRTRRSRLELPIAGALVGTSALIAAMVAVDPRTQAFLAPLLAFYTARGLRLTGIVLDRRAGGEWVRRGFATGLVATVPIIVLLGVDARRLYMATTVGSLHQLSATENRRAAELLRHNIPEAEPVMSWHPAIALHARRDWRVLPGFATFPEIVRYARAIDCEYIVLSFYNPSPLQDDQFPRPYLLVRVTADASSAEQWTIRVTEARGNVAIGRLVAL